MLLKSMLISFGLLLLTTILVSGGIKVSTHSSWVETFKGMVKPSTLVFLILGFCNYSVMVYSILDMEGMIESRENECEQVGGVVVPEGNSTVCYNAVIYEQIKTLKEQAKIKVE